MAAPFASFLVFDTSQDVRDVANAVPPTAAAMSAAAETLAADLSGVHKAALTPSHKPFRLVLSQLLPTLDMQCTAFVTEQLLPQHNHCTRTTFILLAAWHFVAVNPDLLSKFWGSSSSRITQLTTSLAGQLGTLAPRASKVETPNLQAPADAPAVRLRITTFLCRARIVAPQIQAVIAALSFVRTARLSDDETTTYFGDPGADFKTATAWNLPTISEQEPELTVIVADIHLLVIVSTASLHSLILPSDKISRFLPKTFHWRAPQSLKPWWRQREASPPRWFRDRHQDDADLMARGDQVKTKQLPEFHACNVISKAHRWKKRLGKHLGQAARLIIDGKLCLPLTCNEVPVMDRPNLPTCFQSPEATEFVDSIVAEYLVTNVASWYPPTHPPICICPLGVVEKKTFPFYRLVIDARGPNSVTSQWASNMRSLATASHIFEMGSVCFSLDIGKAYICSPYQGCSHKISRKVRADGRPYLHVGCTPEDCQLCCSKGMLGFRWRQQHFAFNAPMFGAKVSGDLLDVLLGPVDRWVRAQGIPFLRWVDDSIYCIPPLPEYKHDTTHCGGVGQCWMCNDTMQRALEIQDKVYDLLEDLGFTFNEKRTTPAQVGEFIGLGWNTLRGTYRIVEGKAAKMAAEAETIIAASVASRRDLAKIRGKLIWFSPCLYSVRLLTRALNRFVGSPESATEWDARVSVPGSVLDELRHWASTLRAHPCHERPMWKLRAPQLFEAYQQGSHLVDAYLEIDASLQGWGCTLRIRSGDKWDELKTSVLWKDGDPTVQVHCESEALARAIQLFLPRLCGLAVLHVTDCEPTLDLPEKGSAASIRLQDSALNVWRLCSFHGIFLTSAWAPGEHMLKSGTDGLSREGLIDTHCARLSENGWKTVQDLARSYSLSLNVDWFADHINNQLARFWAKQHMPGAEGVDALSAPSWAFTRCAGCNAASEVHSYLFPPVPLIDRAIAKAQLDGAKGVIVVPRIVSAVWWPILAAAASSPFIAIDTSVVDTSREHCSKHYRDYRWNVVAFNFRRTKLSSQPCRCATDQPLSSLAAQILHHELLQAKLARALLGDDEPDC